MNVLKRFIKDRPFQFLAPFLAIGCFVSGSALANGNPIASDVLRGMGWLIIGFQWVASARTWRRHREEILETEKELLATLQKSGNLLELQFLVPTESNHTTVNMWNKLRGRTQLRLYSNEGGADSYSTVSAAKKELFEMHLRGFINTDSPKLAWDGLAFLNGRKIKARGIA